MAERQVRLELLLGQRVRDVHGEVAGRIEEVRALRQDDGWIIQEYLVGPAALIERLGAWHLLQPLIRRLGRQQIGGGYRIPWSQLDLTNPDHPRLRCACADLAPLLDPRKTPPSDRS